MVETLVLTGLGTALLRWRWWLIAPYTIFLLLAVPVAIVVIGACYVWCAFAAMHRPMAAAGPCGLAPSLPG